jgi:IclR family KDG regulon transcriptional repressor
LAPVSQLEILTTFDQDVRPASAAEVIERSGLPRSTVFRALKQLVAEGFVYQDSETKRYTLGPRVLRLGLIASRQLGATEILASPLLELARDTRETITFSILDLPDRLCVYVLEAPSDLRQVVQVGARYPLHLGAAGKAILANLPDQLIRSVLKMHPLSTKQVQSILIQLTAIRDRGSAVTTDERVIGASTIAAPVFVDDVIYGSVAVVGPTNRLLPAVESHAPSVLRAAQAIGKNLSRAGIHRKPLTGR